MCAVDSQNSDIPSYIPQKILQDFEKAIGFSLQDDPALLSALQYHELEAGAPIVEEGQRLEGLYFCDVPLAVRESRLIMSELHYLEVLSLESFSVIGLEFVPWAMALDREKTPEDAPVIHAPTTFYGSAPVLRRLVEYTERQLFWSKPFHCLHVPAQNIHKLLKYPALKEYLLDQIAKRAQMVSIPLVKPTAESSEVEQAMSFFQLHRALISTGRVLDDGRSIIVDKKRADRIIPGSKAFGSSSEEMRRVKEVALSKYNLEINFIGNREEKERIIKELPTEERQAFLLTGEWGKLKSQARVKKDGGSIMAAHENIAPCVIVEMKFAAQANSG